MTRQAVIRSGLWALVLGYSFFLAGHVFDIVPVVPNWRSGTPEAAARYRDFTALGGPGTYFLWVLPPTFVAAVFGVLVTWRERPLRRFALTPLVVILIYAVWTTRYFVPINNYIGQDRYDPTTLKALVDGWVFWETARAGLVGLGLVSAIALLERWPHGPRPRA